MPFPLVNHTFSYLKMAKKNGACLVNNFQTISEEDLGTTLAVLFTSCTALFGHLLSQWRVGCSHDVVMM